MSITCDFELAFIKACKDTFPGVLIYGYFFDIHNFGLLTEENSSSEESFEKITFHLFYYTIFITKLSIYLLQELLTKYKNKNMSNKASIQNQQENARNPKSASLLEHINQLILRFGHVFF